MFNIIANKIAKVTVCVAWLIGGVNELFWQSSSSFGAICVIPNSPEL